MGIYLNPGNENFKRTLADNILIYEKRNNVTKTYRKGKGKRK